MNLTTDDVLNRTFAASRVLHEMGVPLVPANGDGATHDVADRDTELANAAEQEPISDGGRREFELSETGMAERVCAASDAFRYVTAWRKFIVFDGKRWKVDDAGAMDRIVKLVVRRTKIDASRMSGGAATELWNHAHGCEANAKIKAVKERIAVERGIPVSTDDLDVDPALLNVANGIIDSRTGELLPHDRTRLITKLANIEYDPAATCPIFDEFLNRILPAETLRRFVKRALGYSITGDTSERVLFMPHGSGANGKSTLLHAVGEVMGDYSSTIPAETLMVRRDGGIPNDIARLKGARFVTAIETDEGRRLAESLVKTMTGGADLLTARFLYGEFFSFRPEFKLWIGTNHKPVVRGTDEAIWDRIRLVPFTVRIPEAERDRELSDKLKVEYPGILAWLVRGCIEWREHGLAAPDEVATATASYRLEMDVLGDFIGDCCIAGDRLIADATPLFNGYKIWCGLHNEEAMTQRRFGTMLGERGYVSGRDSVSGRKTWKGIGLKVSE